MGIKVAVIGAGTMGHALALVYALGGHEVRLTDSAMATLAKAGPLMETALATLVAAGEAPPDRDAEWLHANVSRLATLAETVEEADLIVEAIIEKPDAKRVLFDQIDAVAPMSAILASNTSYLDPFPLIPARRQARAIIMHWYTPPYLVDLVDIVGGPECDPACVEFARELCLAMGKAPVVMRKFVPGYIANRVQSAMGLEIQKLLDEGVATAEEIDTAVIEGIALRLPILGMLAKADFTGLPFMQASLANRMYEPPPVRGKCEAVDALVAEGKTGVMAGAGFYDWGGQDPATLFEARDRRLMELKRAIRRIGTMAGAGTQRMITYDLKGRAALVTGGASGIGYATATLLARSGCAVAINHLADDPRGPEAVARLAEETGARVISAPGSVGDAAEAEAMVLRAVADLGRLDYLVNNAGTPGTRTAVAPHEFDRLTEELWQAVIEVNLLGVFRCAKAAGPALRASRGAIVNTASIAGINSAGSSMAYGATKAGVISLTKNLARGLAPEVRVNAVAPGAVDSTWMIEWTNEQRASSIDNALLKRRCTPEDLAEVMVFLLAGAAMVTGQTVVVDGGLTV